MKKIKLSYGEVEKIKKLYKINFYTQKYIGSLFNIGQDEVGRIVNLLRWKVV